MDGVARPRRAERGEQPPEAVAELLRAQARTIAELRRELSAARREINTLRRENERLRQQLAERDARHPTERLDQAYSLDAEEKRSRGRQKRRQKSPRRGRKSTAEKLRQAERQQIVLPEGCSQDQCRLFRSRPVWRIENGRAVLVAYHLYRGPRGERPQVPGLLSRCEFGQEILVALAYLVFIVRLSMDKVCAQLRFFWELPLTKSEADALLSRLEREWTGEFETLCTLLAHSAVVHADETSWSLRSVWAFLSGAGAGAVFRCAQGRRHAGHNPAEGPVRRRARQR